jgi:hypothetical protein
MKHYPICTFKEFYVNAATAKAELKNWSNWKLWNTVSMIETNREGDLSALYFEPMEASTADAPRIQFVLSKESRVDEFVLDGFFWAEQKIHLQWIITIKGKNKEQLLISTILLEGDSAALYYEKYAIHLTKLLKIMNRDFIQYLNRKYLDTKWFGEDSSLYGYYLK